MCCCKFVSDDSKTIAIAISMVRFRIPLNAPVHKEQMSFVYPAIAFAYAVYHDSRAIHWCHEFFSPLVSSISDTITSIPWSVFGEAIATKIRVVTSNPGFAPWLLAIVSLLVYMFPSRNAREAGGILVVSRAVFLLAFILSLLSFGYTSTELLIKPDHLLESPMIKYALRFFFSCFIIFFQIDSQLPSAVSMNEVLEEARRHP